VQAECPSSARKIIVGDIYDFLETRKAGEVQHDEKSIGDLFYTETRGMSAVLVLVFARLFPVGWIGEGSYRLRGRQGAK
jgi:hypothetical protein